MIVDLAKPEDRQGILAVTAKIDIFTDEEKDTVRELWNETRPTGKWSFSTNGTYWAGKAGIPSIGFGPGDEIHAHTIIDQVSLDDVVAATEFYALFPKMLAEKTK